MTTTTTTQATTDETTPLVAEKKHQNEQQQPTLLGYKIASFLQKFLSFYGTHASLQEAWTHFEFLVLPRRNKNNGSKAPPGTPDTTLFPPCCRTRARDLKDFGTGVCVYFDTLKWLSMICLVAGILYIPSILYYGSDGYTSDYLETPLGPLRGSLLCPHPTWQPCPSCDMQDFADGSLHRIGRDTTNTLTFILKNTCSDLHWKQGMNHLGVMVFLTFAIFMLGKHQERMELQYDELALTAQDYTVQVHNPPVNATDPDEWRDFFESQFGQVAFVTVALNNQTLLEALLKRRELLQKASYKIQDSEDCTLSLQTIPPTLQDKAPKLYHKLQDVNAKCQELLQQEYPTSAVFVIFQKERSQRNCLAAFQYVKDNNTRTLPKEYQFRSTHTLEVSEPPEPNAIRWQDLDETRCDKVKERLITATLTIAIIYGSFQLVSVAFHHSVGVAAIVITLLNILMPKLFIAINTLESHQAEGTYQASLYTKIAIFRWVNTGVVTLLIKNFADFLSDRPDSLIASVQAVLRAEIVIAPLVHIADIGGNVKRHVIAPLFSKNQVAMNRYFRGSRQNLGEKYTNATKTIFLVFFYCAIFPSGFFYGAVALWLTYVTDKFSLLRSWAPMPQLGDHVALLSRKVFFPLTVVVLALMSQLFYTAYPCDNVCDTGEVIAPDSEYVGDHTVKAVDSEDIGVAVHPNVTVAQGDSIFQYCDQDFLDLGFLSYFIQDHSEWMAPEQTQMSHVFGLFSFGVIAGWILMNCCCCCGKTSEERDSGESYSDQPNIHAYVPQIPSNSYRFPLIAAGLDHFEGRYVGWKDPVFEYDHYDLSADVEALGYKGKRPVLSRVRQYC